MKSSELIKVVAQYREWKRIEEDAKKELEKVKDQLKAEMTERNTDEIDGDDFKITWKMVYSNKFDSAALKKEFPELAEKYTTPNNYRRFSVA